MFFNNLYRLINLKKLAIFDGDIDPDSDDSRIIFVRGLTAVVNENLAELEAMFREFTSDELTDLSKSLPNLKKHKIGFMSIKAA